MNNNGLIVSCITNDRLLSMKQLINKLKKNNNYVIYKGARTSKRGLLEIIYNSLRYSLTISISSI